MIKVSNYKVIFGFVLSMFLIASSIFLAYVFLRYEIYQIRGNIRFYVDLFFYSFVSVLSAYQGFTYFYKPTQLEISNGILYLGFPFDSAAFYLNEIKGYSQTYFRARGKKYSILLLYCDGNVYEFWSNWYNINELEELLKCEKIHFLGKELYKFKIVGLFLRKYKHL